MTTYLETTIDKFIIRVAADRLYSAEGIWALGESGRVRIGLSDYLQQRSGDVAFVETKTMGARVAAGDEIAVIETIKVNISLASPVSGVVVETNPLLETTPEVINQDPYGNGWLAIIAADNWDNEKTHLLDPQVYFAQMKAAAKKEIESE